MPVSSYLPSPRVKKAAKVVGPIGGATSIYRFLDDDEEAVPEEAAPFVGPREPTAEQRYQSSYAPEEAATVPPIDAGPEGHSRVDALRSQATNRGSMTAQIAPYLKQIQDAASVGFAGVPADEGSPADIGMRGGSRSFAAGLEADPAITKGWGEIDSLRTKLTESLLDPTKSLAPEKEEEGRARSLLNKHLDKYDSLLSSPEPDMNRRNIEPDKLGAMDRISNLGHQFSMLNSGVNPEQARQFADQRSQQGYYQRMAEEDQRLEQQMLLRKARTDNIEDARKSIIALTDVSTALGDDRRAELTAFKDAAKIVFDSGGDLSMRSSQKLAELQRNDTVLNAIIDREIKAGEISAQTILRRDEAQSERIRALSEVEKAGALFMTASTKMTEGTIELARLNGAFDRRPHQEVMAEVRSVGEMLQNSYNGKLMQLQSQGDNRFEGWKLDIDPDTWEVSVPPDGLLQGLLGGGEQTKFTVRDFFERMAGRRAEVLDDDQKAMLAQGEEMVRQMAATFIATTANNHEQALVGHFLAARQALSDDPQAYAKAITQQNEKLNIITFLNYRDVLGFLWGDDPNALIEYIAKENIIPAEHLGMDALKYDREAYDEEGNPR